MADFVIEQKEGVVRTIVREIDRAGATRGQELSHQDLTGREAFGATDMPQDPAEFATGFDAGTGETVTGFMFDKSVFDGPDQLV